MGRLLDPVGTSTQMGESVLKLLPLPRGSSLFQVFCDMETSGGGWTVIQRRKSGLVSFYQDWRQYKQGFGSIRGDFWLGNEHIHRLTRQPTRLRVELEVSVSCEALMVQVHSTRLRMVRKPLPWSAYIRSGRPLWQLP